MDARQIKKILVEILGEKVVSTRRLDVFTATSYDVEKYRVWFFYLEGSPPMVTGVIEQHWNGYEIFYKFNGRRKTKHVDMDFKLSTKDKVVA